ncbi:MAG TPA: hypothetical protein VEK38_00595 [Candidatus Bathyarchaeia archaeon]|nr:hypothetical protein [Candidatus Bathyarchaeia archaeon]
MYSLSKIFLTFAVISMTTAQPMEQDDDTLYGDISLFPYPIHEATSSDTNALREKLGLKCKINERCFWVWVKSTKEKYGYNIARWSTDAHKDTPLQFPWYLPLKFVQDKKEGDTISLTLTTSEKKKLPVLLTCAQKSSFHNTMGTFENACQVVVNNQYHGHDYLQ